MSLSRTSKLLRSSALALFIASFALPAVAEPGAKSAAATAAEAAGIRIDNFGQVDQTYYRGAQPAGSDYANLAKLGVQTLIDLTSDDGDPGERAATEAAGMKYLHIPMTTHESPTPGQIAEFLEAVDNPLNQPVYVHCVGGRHRTGVMTAVYRMVHDSWNADKAFSEMKQYKFGADFLHAEFKDFVYGYKPAPAVAATTAVEATAKMK